LESYAKHVLLRGEIVALDHYCPPRGKIKRTRSTPYYSMGNKLLLLIYFTIIIRVLNKKSYKKQKKKVGFELSLNKPIILSIAKGGKGRN
jgi:hypothetical protein